MSVNGEHIVLAVKASHLPPSAAPPTTDTAGHCRALGRVVASLVQKDDERCYAAAHLMKSVLNDKRIKGFVTNATVTHAPLVGV